MILATFIFVLSLVVALQFFVCFCHSRVVEAAEIPPRVAGIAGLASRPVGLEQCDQGFSAVSSLLRMIPNNITQRQPVSDREWAGTISVYFLLLHFGHLLSDFLGLNSLSPPVTNEMANAVAYLGTVADHRIERLSTALGRVATLDF